VGRDADDRLLGMVAVIVPGLGVDRISDMVCNILKHRFVAYTQAICLGLGIPAEDLMLNNNGAFQTFETDGIEWNEGVASMGDSVKAVWFSDPDGNILKVSTGEM
jgi:hypothetical protein